MAQAARLSSRMQKELKLLLTDPPPGASFPILSDDCSSSSLTAIDALFQGPQGTVYSNGVFKIKIQIPERYPFQPPAVTFATPIYHPNIDTGGRICLDILNLPPKGTWQPSLNISTVLTSIGLLLSEPNPDDGLMHEASREYKYNRQVFDQIARSMTEKYARAGECESSGASRVNQPHTDPSTSHQNETEGSDAFPAGERFKISSNKLSLKSIQSSCNSKSEKEILKEANIDSTSKCNEGLGKSQSMRNKMSLSVSRIRSASQCSSMLDTKTTSNDPPEPLPLVQEVVGNHLSIMDEDYIDRSSSMSVVGKSLHCVKMGEGGDPDEKPQSFSIRTSHNPSKRVATSGVVKKVGPQSHSEDEKENSTPVQRTANGMHSNERRVGLVAGIGTHKPLKPVDEPAVISHSENQSSPLSEFLQVKNDVRSNEKQQIKQVLDGEESNDKFQQTEEGLDITEAVIVLDSEDEDDVPVRSKLKLPRRCLSRKRKGNLPSYR